MYDSCIKEMTLEEMKHWFIQFTGWDESIVNSMTDDQIRTVYKERVERRNV